MYLIRLNLAKRKLNIGTYITRYDGDSGCLVAETASQLHLLFLRIGNVFCATVRLRSGTFYSGTLVGTTAMNKGATALDQRSTNHTTLRTRCGELKRGRKAHESN